MYYVLHLQNIKDESDVDDVENEDYAQSDSADIEVKEESTECVLQINEMLDNIPTISTTQSLSSKDFLIKFSFYQTKKVILQAFVNF